MSLWNFLIKEITKDDLFIRVTLVIFGLLAIMLGLLIFSAPFFNNFLITLAFFVIGFLLTLWGAIVIIGSFSSPISRWNKLAKSCYPNPSGLDDLAVFLIIILIPSVLLTLLFRAFGVNGCVDSN